MERVDSHSYSDVLCTRLHHLLYLAQLLISELLLIPRLLVCHIVLFHRRVQEERTVLNLDLEVTAVLLDIFNRLLQLALPDVAPWADLEGRGTGTRAEGARGRAT